MMPVAKIDEPLWALVLLVAVAFPLHEMGHLLALRLLGWHGGVKMGALGLAVSLPVGVQGWRLAVVAASGPAANLLVMWLALHWQLAFAQALAQVNFVLAAVNLLPILPLDGGKMLLGLFSGLVAWRRLAGWLLFAARAWAVALVLCVYYFGLSRWLVVAALWLYLLAMQENRRLGYLLAVGLAACRGQSWRPLRCIRLWVDEPLWRVERVMSPGWRNVLWLAGRQIDGDELLDCCEAGGGAAYLSEILKDWRIKKDYVRQLPNYKRLRCKIGRKLEKYIGILRSR